MPQPSDFKTPGQYLEALLNERGWTKRVLAVVLDVDETIINKVISGKRALNAPLALSIAEVFEINAGELLQLQKDFDLAQAQIVARPDPNRTKRAILFGGLPVSEMIKRGWLDAKDVRDVSSVEKSLIRFFGAQSLDEIELLPHAAKKTDVFGKATPAQLAWLYRVKQIASEMVVPRYNKDEIQASLAALGDLLNAPEEIRKVPRILAQCGIRFLIVETLPGAKIDGACLWLDETSPVIGMSVRYDRIDNFWFVLRHEIEHVLQGHGRDGHIMLDSELEGENAGTGDSIAVEERVANLAAANFCVPQGALDRFIARKAPFFAERDLLGFSRTVKVHPGLVAGQLQRRTNRFDRFRVHLVKVRSCIAPSAIVDGWGDVVPLNT